jgi:hypothetical protein
MSAFTRGALIAGAVVLVAPDAQAQIESLEEGFGVGAWTFYPSVEVRLRGEYRRNPPEIGGDLYDKTAVQHDAFQSATPGVVARAPAVSDEWVASERTRLGLEVTYDVLGAKVVLQDSRVFGATPGVAVEQGFGEFAPYEAYLSVRTDLEDPWLSVRLGRQRVRWGDGRLLGDRDWSPRPLALDAARAMLSFGPVDVELLGALIALPGPVPEPYGPHGQTFEGTGAQLYGLDLRWAIIPLFQLEAMTLVRVARDPLPLELARSDTYTFDLRISGAERGIEYAAEGAYQTGRTAGYGENLEIGAWAVAGRFAWQTALPWSLRIGAHGGYASGDDSPGADGFSRFDPILPTVHEHGGMMDLYAWSNVIEGGGDVSIKPHDALRYGIGYTFVGLAEPGDRWSTAYLLPVGAAPGNESQVVGHEIETSVKVSPWDWMSFSGGYGFLLLGDGGKAVMASAGRADTDLMHYAFLQAEVKAP